MGCLTPKYPQPDTADVTPARGTRRRSDPRILLWAAAAVPSAVVGVMAMNAAGGLNLPVWAGAGMGLIVFAAWIHVVRSTLATVLARRARG